MQHLLTCLGKDNRAVWVVPDLGVPKGLVQGFGQAGSRSPA